MPFGSGAPDSIGQQVPRRVGRTHETHGPLQAALQQTPYAHDPLAQSASWAHVAPFIRRPQLPAWHCRPLTHWPFDVQPSKHTPVPGLQENGTQMIVGPGLQRPSPSHTCAPITASPSHVPDLHDVPAMCLRQPPAPSHVPSSPQPLAGPATHVLAARGLPPASIPTQTPGDPSDAHVMQPAVQAALQQTPSTQKPLAHSAPQPHACPLVLRPPSKSQLPPSPAGASGAPSRLVAVSRRPSEADASASARRGPSFPQPSKIDHSDANNTKYFNFHRPPGRLFESSNLTRAAYRHPPTSRSAYDNI